MAPEFQVLSRKNLLSSGSVADYDADVHQDTVW